MPQEPDPGGTLGDRPYSLEDLSEKAARLELLRMPHVLALASYVDALRAKRGHECQIPYFDPFDGGLNAMALFLLEAPGPKAIRSGFISRNNPDPSAKNMFHLQAEAGLNRRKTISWNIVPWYVGDGRRIRGVTAGDLTEALKYLPALLGLLPTLTVVVLVGRKAQSAASDIQRLTDVPLLGMWHPSQRVLNVWPERRAEMLAVLRQVATLTR